MWWTPAPECHTASNDRVTSSEHDDTVDRFHHRGLGCRRAGHRCLRSQNRPDRRGATRQRRPRHDSGPLDGAGAQLRGITATVGLLLTAVVLVTGSAVLERTARTASRLSATAAAALMLSDLALFVLGASSASGRPLPQVLDRSILTPYVGTSPSASPSSSPSPDAVSEVPSPTGAATPSSEIAVGPTSTTTDGTGPWMPIVVVALLAAAVGGGTYLIVRRRTGTR